MVAADLEVTAGTLDLPSHRLINRSYGEAGPAKQDASERSESSHANGASRRSGSRESVSGSPRGEAPRIKISAATV